MTPNCYYFFKCKVTSNFVISSNVKFAKSQRAVENGKKMKETGCEVFCGAPTTLAVKGKI